MSNKELLIQKLQEVLTKVQQSDDGLDDACKLQMELLQIDSFLNDVIEQQICELLAD